MLTLSDCGQQMRQHNVEKPPTQNMNYNQQQTFSQQQNIMNKQLNNQHNYNQQSDSVTKDL